MVPLPLRSFSIARCLLCRNVSHGAFTELTATLNTSADILEMKGRPMSCPQGHPGITA